MFYRILMAAFICLGSPAYATAPVFKFHLLTEPLSLDPQRTSASSGNYLFHNLYRGLFSYSRSEGLRPEGALSCARSRLRLTCNLRKMSWSNGAAVTADQYVNSFRRLIDPAQKSPQADVLFALKNAREIWDGKKPSSELGVRARSQRELIFEFAYEDPEFEFRLIHPALSPLPPGGFRSREEGAAMPVTGPYKLAEWKHGAWARLEPNPKYVGGEKSRPSIEAYFIEEDSTALRLFESGKLTFLRRLVAAEIPRFRSRPEFHQIPIARFDYVGFGPALRDQADARTALIQSVEYADFKRLFDSKGDAGCPSLPAAYLDRPACLKFNPVAAKKAAERAGKPKLTLHFSKMGGDDIARAAEWFQGQWKKNLGWNIELRSQEQGTYLSLLRTSPPPIFRKGVSLDRPTCLAALEIFLKDNPENFIRLDDSRYAELVARLHQSPLPVRKKACREAVEHLLTLNRIIPLGEIHFTILASTKFAGWELNELNQLDLSRLKAL